MKIAALLLAAASMASAGKLSDSVMTNFFYGLQTEEYAQAVKAVADSSSSSISDKFQQKKSSEKIASQLKGMIETYGTPTSFESVSVERIGRVEKTTYLVYCPATPIRVELIEYTPQNIIPYLIGFQFDAVPAQWFKAEPWKKD